MAIGSSGRVVVELDPQLKHKLHVALREDGKNMKDWLVENAKAYLEGRYQPTLDLLKNGGGTA